MTLSVLHGVYQDMPAYIVGKGPSLKYLTADHFSVPDGPVIVLNDAIIAVEKIGIPNQIFSLQKDGCHSYEERDACKPDCGSREHMVYPSSADVVLIQQRLYSPFCLPSHENKLWIDDIRELGIKDPPEMAVIMSIRLAQIMGCNRLTMLCFGSLVNEGELRTYDPRTGTSRFTTAGIYYAHARQRVLKLLSGVDHEIIIPKESTNEST